MHEGKLSPSVEGDPSVVQTGSLTEACETSSTPRGGAVLLFLCKRGLDLTSI